MSASTLETYSSGMPGIFYPIHYTKVTGVSGKQVYTFKFTNVTPETYASPTFPIYAHRFYIQVDNVNVDTTSYFTGATLTLNGSSINALINTIDITPSTSILPKKPYNSTGYMIGNHPIALANNDTFVMTLPTNSIVRNLDLRVGIC